MQNNLSKKMRKKKCTEKSKSAEVENTPAEPVQAGEDKILHQSEIKVKVQRFGTVTISINLGATYSDDGSKPEILSRIAQATAALTQLKPV